MVQFIVSEKYETILNLHEYSIEEFLALFELVIVKNVNQAMEMKIAKQNMLKK
jgi:hypothetical protein